MHFTENFALFNLLKLLGGVSDSQRNGANAATPTEENLSARQNSTPADGVAATEGATPPAEKHNVMADVIERHERIANRARRTQ